MKAKHNLSELEAITTRLRLHVVNMVAPSGQGYVQQGLCSADIFASLYFTEATMNKFGLDAAAITQAVRGVMQQKKG
jgi:transketolase